MHGPRRRTCAIVLTGAVLSTGCSAAPTEDGAPATMGTPLAHEETREEAPRRVRQGAPIKSLHKGHLVGITNLHAEKFPSWHYGSLTICARSAPAAVLQSLEPMRTIGNIELQATGAQGPGGKGVAGWPGPIPRRYQPLKGFTDIPKCKAGRAELIVQVGLRRSGAGSGAVDGFILRYRAGNRSYVDRWPDVELALCDASASEPATLEGPLRYCADSVPGPA